MISLCLIALPTSNAHGSINTKLLLITTIINSLTVVKRL